MQKITLMQLLTYINFLIAWLPLYSMSPASLKDTYTIFTEPYQHLSPLHGALLWESGVVKNYYDTALQTLARSNQWLPNVDGPIRLARALFTDTLGNFDVSNNPNYPARHLGISTIGTIIALLERSKQQVQQLDSRTLEDIIIRDTEFSQSVSTINLERESTRAHYDLRIAQCESQHQQEQIPQLKYSYSIAMNKLDTQRLYQDWTRQQSIAQIRAHIAQIDELVGKEKNRAQKERTQKVRALESLQMAQGGGDYNRVHELAQAIIDAHTPSPYYPGQIAEWILLACMYRKAKNKQELVPYISVLTQKLGPQVCKPTDDSWNRKLYTPSDCDAIKQQISPWMQSGIPDPIEPAIYENIAYAQIMERYYKGPFPKIAEYTNIVVQGLSFPDCVEVTLFNFCNMVLYDRQSGTFDIHRAPHGVSSSLTDFYNDPINKQAINIGLASVHQSWGAMFQNWPLVTYRKQILHNTDGTQTILTAPKDTNGFIYGLPESILAPLKQDRDRVLVAGRWYIHLKEPHGYLCEMHPTVRNFLIILNQLFNLNLFADIPVESAFLSERFNAIYFPRLCEHFELLRGIQWTMPLLTILDRDEYTDKGIQLTFAHFDLILTDEHAEIITNVKGENIADLGPQLIKRSSESTDSSKRWSMAQLLSIFPMHVTQLPQTNPFPYLLYLPLHNNHTKIEAALFCIHKLSDPTLTASDRSQLIDRAISFIRQLPERLDWHYHEELLNKLDERALQYPFAQQEIERILSVAKGRLKGVPADCEYLPSLYTALISKGQNRDDVMIVVDNLLSRPEPFDRRPLLNLLIVLARQGKAVPQAHQAVEICIHNSIEAERLLAQTLRDIIKQ